MATRDDQVASTTRTKRIRAAHRGAVTRLINQMSDVSLSADIGRQKLLKQALVNKINVLSRLDEELLLTVAEEELDSEVEQADLVKERAELAVIELSEMIANVNKNSEREPLRQQRQSSTPSLSEESEENPRISHPPPTTNGDELDTFFLCTTWQH